MPNERDRSRRELTVIVRELTDEQVIDLVRALTCVLEPTTSASFVSALRSVPPAEFRLLLLELAEEIERQAKQD